MTEQLFLNKKKVDLKSKPITRKIQIGDFGDVSERKSAFSYSIKLPRTANNVQILDMLGVTGNISRKPYENIIADYIVDGVSLVVDGYVVISSTTDFFELNIYDGIIDLGERLKGKKLSELPLADLDHILTAQNVVNSFANTEGYIYGLADFGLGYSSAVKAEKIAPSVYTHTILRKIFESNGLNLVGSFFDSNKKYLSEVVTPVKGYEINDTPFVSTAKGTATTNNLSGYENSRSYIQFNKEFTPSLTSADASVSGNKIIFNASGLYKIDVSVNFSSYKTFIQFRVKINEKVVSYSHLASQSDSGSGTKTISINFSVQAGDEVSFILNGSSDYGSGEVSNFNEPSGFNEIGKSEPEYYEVNYSVSASADLFLQEGGQLIEIKNSIGDTSQLDFVKDVLKRFALILNPIKNSSDYRFAQLEAVLSDRNKAEEWTSKYKETLKENYVSGYAQSNKAVYKYPEAIVVPNNDGEMIIDNRNATFEKNLFTSIFEVPVATLKKIEAETVFSVPIWELKDSVVELKETPIKTMKIHRVDSVITVALFSDANPVQVSTGVPVLSMQEMSLQFYVGNYYKAFQALVNSFKEVDFNLNLSLIDVFNIDFFRLKYLKQTGRFYYLNSLTHTPQKTSKAVMIEISEFPTNQPPSQVGDFAFNMSHGSTRTVTAANLLTGYFDAELDAALKVKFLTGFNSNLIMKQDGVDVTVETEILFEDLNLTIFDALGGLDAYSESWTFTIADEGSGEYSSEIGTLTANVIELVNQPPVANAGSNQTKGFYAEGVTQPIYFYVSGAASFDNTGEIVSFDWLIQSRPAGAPLGERLLGFNTASPRLEVPNDIDYLGIFVLKLTVTDEFGATSEDTVQLELTSGDWFKGGLQQV